MTMNHAAIYRAYPQVVAIFDDRGAFDAAGNPVALDQAKVDAAAIIVAQEQALASAQRNRAAAYTTEADPLFFKAQRGEDRKSTRLNSSHVSESRMPSSA